MFPFLLLYSLTTQVPYLFSLVWAPSCEEDIFVFSNMTFKVAIGEFALGFVTFYEGSNISVGATKSTRVFSSKEAKPTAVFFAVEVVKDQGLSQIIYVLMHVKLLT